MTLKPVDPAVHLQEGLLDGILCILAISGGMQRNALETTAVRPVEMFERGHLPPTAGSQQLSLGIVRV
jgi:hypothetical protein